jgi:uncharacterized protein (DUF1684 family)
VSTRQRLAVVLALVAAAGCTSGPPPPDDSAYLSEVAAARARTDQFFLSSPESPVPPDRKAALLPLNYYAIDAGYIVPAALQLSEERPVFEMPTSTGVLRRMQLVGVLEFRLAGAQRSLGAFVEEGAAVSQLFVPFADHTTGIDTYAAGRYLANQPTATGLYNNDINRAYNPYCSYNEENHCPYPPPSNRLVLAVQAGEKSPGA